MYDRNRVVCTSKRMIGNVRSEPRGVYVKTYDRKCTIGIAWFVCQSVCSNIRTHETSFKLLTTLTPAVFDTFVTFDSFKILHTFDTFDAFDAFGTFDTFDM